MNKLTMLLAAGALVVGAQQAKALTFSDADAIGVEISGGGGSYNNTFDIVNPDGTSTFTVASAYGVPTAGATFNSALGFNNATDSIVSGSGSMGFWFRVGPNAAYDVVIEDITLSSVGNGTTLTANVLLQTGLSVDIEAELQANGAVTYNIINNGPTFNADVRLDYAYLTIDATRREVNTPDGGATAMLLGVGALGLAGLRRKLS